MRVNEISNLQYDIKMALGAKDIRIEVPIPGKSTVGVASSSEHAGDPLYEEVKEVIVSTRKASISLIQRKFSIGYASAARLIDTIEENGMIGPARGSKPREAYIKNEEEYYE